MRHDAAGPILVRRLGERGSLQFGPSTTAMANHPNAVSEATCRERFGWHRSEIDHHSFENRSLFVERVRAPARLSVSHSGDDRTGLVRNWSRICSVVDVRNHCFSDNRSPHYRGLQSTATVTITRSDPLRLPEDVSVVLSVRWQFKTGGLAGPGDLLRGVGPREKVRPSARVTKREDPLRRKPCGMEGTRFACPTGMEPGSYFV